MIDPQTVLVGVPAYTGQMSVQTVAGLADSRDLYGRLHVIAGDCSISNARNLILREFKKRDYRCLVMIDTDIAFTRQQFARLLYWADPDIPRVVAGIYAGRINAMPQWKPRSGGTKHTTALVEADWVGAGFMLIPCIACDLVLTSGLARNYPMGDDIVQDLFPSGWCQTGSDETRDEWVTDDVGFCRLCWKAGVPVMVDTELCVGHVGTRVVKVTDPWPEGFGRQRTAPRKPTAAKPQEIAS